MPFSDPHHPLWKPENLRRAIHAAGVALWSWNVTNDRFAMDEQAFKLWGLIKDGEVRFEDLSAHIHPADRDRVRAAFTATRGILGSYEIDFRIMVGEEIRWISARADWVMMPLYITDRCSECFLMSLVGSRPKRAMSYWLEK